MDTDRARRQLEELASSIAQGERPSAEAEWSGADVAISARGPQSKPGSFYPQPRYVVTPDSLALSGLFEAMRDIFYDARLVDHCSKIELFGRLANAANRYIARAEEPSTLMLLQAVLHEGLAIVDEIEEGTFEYYTVALGNSIADDSVDEALRSGFLSPEDTRRFFLERGIELNDD